MAIVDGWQEKLIYGCADESLGAIMRGLVPNKNDVILGIIGSGDPGLLLASFCDHVDLVDVSFAQTAYLQKRMELAAVRDYDGFMSRRANERYIEGIDDPARLIELLPVTHWSGIRNRYFTPRVIDRVVSNPPRIFESGDVFDVVSRRTYDKVYLNNTFRDVGDDEYLEKMAGISEVLPVGGLVYLTCAKSFPSIDIPGMRVSRGLSLNAKIAVFGEIPFKVGDTDMPLVLERV